MGVPEAQLKQVDAGQIVDSEGWFVLNARDATWLRSEERGQDTDFEGKQEWTQLGFRIQILGPGQRGMYHRERTQEDFLVVSGECILLIEGEERRLKAWDFVHCPPWTEHTFVAAGEEPCVIVMAGSRVGGFDVVYPVSEVAAKHGAGVRVETSRPDEAYAHWGTGRAVGLPRGLAAEARLDRLSTGHAASRPLEGGRELALQGRKRALEGALDCAREQEPVEEADDPAAWLVFDDEPVHEPVAVRLEVALMPCVGQAGLCAGVRHEPVRLERRDRHRQLAFATR